MTTTRLTPVLEFDPYEHRLDRPAPSVSIEDSPEVWERFWRDSLADAGIADLSPLPGTWVVAVRDVQSAKVLEHVVCLHVGEPSLVAFFETLEGPFDPVSAMNEFGDLAFDGITPLRGGIALDVSGATEGSGRITPECCGDLSNWRDWQNAVRATAEQWLGVWIGHPEARVRRLDADLIVQKVLESGEPTGSLIRVAPEALEGAVETARAELRALEERLRPILRAALQQVSITPPGDDVEPLARRFSEHLAGLGEFGLD